MRRLRIYPHALRDRNAYYSPAKKALLFGYFPVTSEGRGQHAWARSSSPACRTTSLRTKSRTRCSTACIRGSTSPATRTCTPSTRRSRTSWPCSSTSPTRPSSKARFAARAATSTPRACSPNSPSSSDEATGRGSALRDALGGDQHRDGQWEPRKPDPQALDKTLRCRMRAAPFWSRRSFGPSC